MRDPLSKKITGIAPSGIRKFFDIVSEMPDAISLGVGEPDFDTPWRVREEGIYTLEKGRTFYTSNAGLKELRQEISNYLDRKIHVRYDYVHEVMVTVGGSEGIDLTMRAMLNPGDEVLVPEPSYVSYAPCVTLADGVPVPIPMKEENEFKLTAEELEAAITPKTKILVLPFPNNPTGAVYSKELLMEIVEIARQHNLIIFADEIYDKILYDEAQHHSIAALAPDLLTVTFNGLSKTYRVAGFRQGWMVLNGPKKHAKGYIEGLEMLASMRLCANVPAQHAIQTALGGYQSISEFIVPGGRLYEQRNRAWELINEIPGVSCVKPNGALYMFPKIDAKRFNIHDDQKMVLDFLLQEKVLLVQGSAFNWPWPDHVRIVTLPREDDLEMAISRFGRFLSGYHQL